MLTCHNAALRRCQAMTAQGAAPPARLLLLKYLLQFSGHGLSARVRHRHIRHEAANVAGETLAPVLQVAKVGHHS